MNNSYTHAYSDQQLVSGVGGGGFTLNELAKSYLCAVCVGKSIIDPLAFGNALSASLENAIFVTL
jgi:hypothetical protein